MHLRINVFIIILSGSNNHSAIIVSVVIPPNLRRRILTVQRRNRSPYRSISLHSHVDAGRTNRGHRSHRRRRRQRQWTVVAGASSATNRTPGVQLGTLGVRVLVGVLHRRWWVGFLVSADEAL
uniref:(northern house mosquito) hypothetical protein n=1 Tax=Culex pipiens TaxID=7175 RepID=A0A8D8AVD7_CULPI